MRIVIDSSVANDPDVHQWLDRILYKIEDGWHVWDTADQPDPDEMEATTWIRDRGVQGDWVREMLVASIQRGAWTLAPHGRSVLVTAHPRTTDELMPEDAFRLADEPLWILVENRISDGAFVERVVKELDESLRTLWKRPGAPIQIDSVGGKGQMPQEVQRRTERVPYRPRFVAVIDSDRKAPDAGPSTEARRLLRTCAQLNLPCWILAKREAENYLPRILLSERQNVGEDHERRVDAWNRLNDDQKNCFDMKSGLPKTLSPVEQELFGELSPADRTILSSGFGPHLHACWTLCNVPAKTELAVRGQGDLERGIDLIRREV